MSDAIIRVENLSKKYVLSHQDETVGRYKTFRGAMTNAAKLVVGAFNWNKKQVDDKREEFWALRDVSFEIKQGDRVGIIGRNGAGKSTLLKILSRITEPTKGRISIKGRVASLLEVGTGFHPELTGRENIFLNGAILGMSKIEIQRKFDEIVAFAEVEKFLDTPVKRYSSGMYVRLAFAVAAHLEPEILIVDEVLAVGDSTFQKKCLGKMQDVGKEGRTVIFVSHNMAAINTLCSKGIVLNKGQAICSGSIENCIAVYEERNLQRQGAEWIRPLDQKGGSLVITQIKSNLEGEQPNLLLNLKIYFESKLQHKSAFLAIDILDSTGVAIMQALPQLEGFLTDTEPEKVVNVCINLPPLIPNQYLITVWVGSHNTETLDEVREVIMFEIYESPTVGRSFPHTKEHGYIVPTSTLSLINDIIKIQRVGNKF